MSQEKSRSLYKNKGVNSSKGYDIVTIYAPNIRESKYIKQISIELKGEVDINTVTGGDLNTTLPIMNRSSRQKSIKQHIWTRLYTKYS